MIKLIENGLFGDRLYPVDQPMMAERYNQCLEDIGIPPTALKHFHIDGWGWSPEIAEEKDDRYYLSHGPANPYSIILTPEQVRCPLYMPFHTFDWDIHRRVFENYPLQIEDTTSRHAIWFELDQNITAYRGAQDLLMMDIINVRFRVTGDILSVAAEQKELISRFSKEKYAWLNRNLREQIIQSSKRYGDLRFRNLELADMPIANIHTYYTSAYGGLYIFKKLVSNKPMIIFEDNSSQLSNDSSNLHMEFNIEDRNYIPYLFNQKLLSIDPAFIREHVFLIDQQLEFMFVRALAEHDESINISGLNNAQKKGLKNTLIKTGKLGDDFIEMERIYSMLAQPSASNVKIPEHLSLMFAHPDPEASREEKIVLWQLLTSIRNANPILKYAFHKAAFYTEYQSWKDPMKDWAIQQIKANPQIFHQLIP